MTQSILSLPSGLLMKCVGESIKAHVKAAGTVKAFVERSGIARNSLYRLFAGEPVGADTLLLALQALDRVDVLELLTMAPSISPLDRITPKNHKRFVGAKHTRLHSYHVQANIPVVASMKHTSIKQSDESRPSAFTSAGLATPKFSRRKGPSK